VSKPLQFQALHCTDNIITRPSVSHFTTCIFNALHSIEQYFKQKINFWYFTLLAFYYSALNFKRKLHDF